MSFKFKKILPIFIIGILYSSAISQIQFDYISEWSDIFFSNINLISEQPEFISAGKSGDTSPRILFHSSLSFNDFYRERRGELNRGIFYINQENILWAPIYAAGLLFVFGARYNLSHKEMYYDLTRDESMRLKNASRGYMFSLQTQIWQDHIVIRSAVGRKNSGDKSYYPWNIGLYFSPTESITLRYHHYDDYFRWEYNFNLKDPPILLIANEYSQLDQFDISYKIIAPLFLKAGMQNNYINKNRTISEKQTTLIPMGTQYQRNIAVEYFPRQNLSMIIQYYDRKNSLSGYFYDSFQIFGKLTEQMDISKIYRSEILYWWDSQSLGLNVEWGNGEISYRGHLESWPFTPTWIDLLGIRYNFRSFLSYHLYRIGARYRYKKAHWHFYFDTAFERMQPGGEAKTWEPQILVFGIQNLNVYSLTKENRDGIYLGIQIGRSFGGGLKLSYQFQQYIPIEFSKSQASGPSVGSTDLKVYGGGKHYLHFNFTL
jgi:hypothetical protein